eukprot:11935310-Ditylum_brightwellii.AAC.1
MRFALISSILLSIKASHIQSQGDGQLRHIEQTNKNIFSHNFNAADEGDTISQSSNECGIPDDERFSLLLTELSQVSSIEDLSDSSTPQGKTLNWLANEDGLGLCPGDVT